MSGEKIITVWITKYALTTGIMETQAVINDTIAVYYVDGVRNSVYKHWVTSEEKAKERAEEMRFKKLKSLEKQIKKIKALIF